MIVCLALPKKKKTCVSETAQGDLNVTVNGVPFVMKLVKGGTFQMGSEDSDAFGDEKPVHGVTLSSFYIGETEVTQSFWKAVMCAEQASSSWTDEFGRGDNYPAYRVSWNDCQDFIHKLNDLTGYNFRLPTEAEWEFAARGGNSGIGYKYAGGNSIGDLAWYQDNSGRKTHEVKTKSPNELGLYDMNGNVWEWCGDYWKSNYDNGSQTNPKGPSSGTDRVLRGGSWDNIPRLCRVSSRRGRNPGDWNYYIGLRLCLSSKTKASAK